MAESDSVCRFWKDKNRRFTRVNQAFLDYYGLKGIEEVRGKTDEEMHWHLDDSAYRDDEVAVLQEGKIVYYSRGKCIVHGRVKNILATKIPIYKDGVIVGLTGYFVDVDERERNL